MAPDPKITRSYTFSKQERIAKPDDFRRAMAKGKRAAGTNLVVWAFGASGLPFNRLGISVSRKTGGAVQRNRFKRLVREVFRTSKYDLRQGHDIIVVVKKGKKLHNDYHELKEELSGVWRRIGIL